MRTFCSDAEGFYAHDVASVSSPAFVCVVVQVLPPAPAGLAQAEVSGARVYLSQRRSGPPSDSVRVDVVLRPAG